MITTEALQTYFRACRQIDWAFQVEESLEEPAIKRYIGGDSERQQVFTLTGKDTFRAGEINTEHLKDWLEAQNHRKHFPALPDGKQALRLECLSAGYLYTTADEPGRYQIRIRLTYYTGGNPR